MPRLFIRISEYDDALPPITTTITSSTTNSSAMLQMLRFKVRKHSLWFLDHIGKQMVIFHTETLNQIHSVEKRPAIIWLVNMNIIMH